MSPRPHFHSRKLLYTLSSLAALCSVASAADTDGTWNTANAGNWSNTANWLGGGVADGAGFTATFEAPKLGGSNTNTTNTITLDTDRTLGGLSFLGNASTGTHRFNIGGPGILTLESGATPTINLNLASRAAYIFATIAGTQGLDYSSTNGDLYLAGDNTYTGVTTINSGTLFITHNHGLGSTADGTVLFNSGTSIALTNDVVVTGESLVLRGTGATTDGALVASGNGEWAGDVFLGRVTGEVSIRIGTRTDTSRLTISGVIADGTASNLDISGLGTVIFSGENTYTGHTRVYRGTLKFDLGNNRLPTGTTLIIGGTGDDSTVDLNGYSQTVAALQSQAGSGTRTLTNTSGTTASLTVNQTIGTETFDGIVSGNLSIIKDGNGTLNLTGTANTFTGGITVNGGTLGIVTAFIDDTADVSIANSAIFDLDFVGTDTIGGLYLAGLAQNIGTYGAIGSGADNESSFFTGAGLLNVTTYTSAIPEPSSITLIGGIAALGFGALRRRRR